MSLSVSDMPLAAPDLEHIRELFPQVELKLCQTSAGHIVLTLIEIPDHLQGQGLGSRVMLCLTDFADRHGRVIALDPCAVGGRSLFWLKSWYHQFGFCEINCPGIAESMVRLPNKQSA